MSKQQLYIATNLELLLCMQGLSQTQLAKDLNLSSSAIVSNWVKAKATPPIDKLIVVCQYFNVTIDDFVKIDFRDRVNYFQKSA